MLKWVLNLFTTSEIDKKKKEMARLQKKAFDAQRNGNLSLSGEYSLAAEALENEILELMKEEKT